ncbi:MAG: FixH family protein [Sediminibacterium sp.]|nr:FixH family protein [Sediminibacterium sp.]MDP1810902.1 FixH family protein [Sediminibacterium sp.]MDP3128981.1 FixH family protein [Sediminibacterium sp.]MDP3666534.1 FixH family protein [Sediminibacterium sp.]
MFFNKNNIYAGFSLIVIAITMIFIASCSKNDVPPSDPTQGLTKLSEGYAAGAATKVEVYTKESVINTGFTKFYIALSDSVSGKRLEDAHIRLTPMMNMSTMQHSAPYENPESETAVNYLYPCSVVFTMPSTGGSWTVKLTIHNHLTNKEGSLTIPVTVKEPTSSRLKSFIALHDGSKYFISLIEPSTPKVGINDLEIAIYKKVSMMSFPADSSLLATFIPEMPTMGHSSPNNVNPVHIKNGHYKGKVNFTMTGLWRLNFDFMSGAAIADTTQSFDITF